MFMGKLGSGEEAMDAVPIDDEPALVCIRNRKLEYCFLIHRRLGVVPYERLASLAQTQFYLSIRIIRAHHFRCDGVANVDVLQSLARGEIFAPVNNAPSEWGDINEKAQPPKHQ